MIRGFPNLNLSQIELIWMTLGIVNINSCVTFKLPTIKKKLPCDNGISCRLICLQGVVSLIFYLLFTVTSNNNTMNIKNRIGNRNYHCFSN